MLKLFATGFATSLTTAGQGRVTVGPPVVTHQFTWESDNTRTTRNSDWTDYKPGFIFSNLLRETQEQLQERTEWKRTESNGGDRTQKKRDWTGSVNCQH